MLGGGKISADLVSRHSSSSSLVLRRSKSCSRYCLATGSGLAVGGELTGKGARAQCGEGGNKSASIIAMNEFTPAGEKSAPPLATAVSERERSTGAGVLVATSPRVVEGRRACADRTGVLRRRFEVLPEWAPLAAARFKELLEAGFYKRTRFHRVLQGFLPGDLSIAQFGISTSRGLNTEWLCKTCKPLPDEPRTQSNTKGTLSFAQASQKNTRQTQVFINLADNGGIPSFLDGPFPLGQEFTPFSRVVSGMELLPKLHGEASVDQGKAAYYVEEYLDQVFPQLSVVEDVNIIL